MELGDGLKGARSVIFGPAWANKHARDGQNVMDAVEFGVGDVFNGEVRRPFETTVPHPVAPPLRI
jgi:hypothetical protein